MSAAGDAAAAAFRDVHDASPSGVWSAPGRVNLIGEHTDYNDGFVLPFALTKRIAAAASARTDGMLTLASIDSDGVLHTGKPLPIAELSPGVPSDWRVYPAGVAWALRRGATDYTGALTAGADIVLATDVPTGAGLSSSAALECAVAMALLGLGGQREPDTTQRTRIAVWAQRAENEYVGAPTGILDQMAAMCCSDGHAMYLDVRSGVGEPVPFDPAAAGLTVLVIDTRTKHSHGESEYGERRMGTERAAAILGVPALRDVTEQALPEILPLLPQDLHGLVRHVVTENQRVLDVVELLRANKIDEVGKLLNSSHESLSKDYRVSSTELDHAVGAAQRAGALGARMTGGGFGGSAIALVHESRQDAVREAVRTSFSDAGLSEPRFFTALPAPGAALE